MQDKLILKKCKKCGVVVQILGDYKNEEFELKCCDEPMKTVEPNTVECAVEKHIPNYTVEGDTICVKVEHVMEEKHYIEWIALVSENTQKIVQLKPGDVAEATFPYEKGSTIYAYCNLHELWKKEVM